MSGLEYAAPTMKPPTLRFEGAEHTAIGDDTLLRFARDAASIPAREVQLHLPNGLALTYGQVIALGGDFYAIPGQRSAMAPPLPTACNASSQPLIHWQSCLLRGKKQARSWR